MQWRTFFLVLYVVRFFPCSEWTCRPIVCSLLGNSCSRCTQDHVWRSKNLEVQVVFITDIYLCEARSALPDCYGVGILFVADISAVLLSNFMVCSYSNYSTVSLLTIYYYDLTRKRKSSGVAIGGPGGLGPLIRPLPPHCPFPIWNLTLKWSSCQA